MILGYHVRAADVRNGRVHLKLAGRGDGDREHVTEHVIAGTGYKVNLSNVPFLGRQMLSEIACVNGSPVLSRNFESSSPGLYFVGLAAANSSGPVLRFTFGADFAARRLIEHFGRSLRRKALPKQSVPVPT